VRGVPVTGRFVGVLMSAALAGAALAACGGSDPAPAASTARTTSAVGVTGTTGTTGAIGQAAAPVQTATGATIGSVCSLKSSPAVAGNPPPGTCVIQFGNGDRYQCPIAVGQNPEADPATSSACHKVTPPKIPASWQPTLRRLAAIKTCLKHAGILAVGGSVPPAFQSHPDTPIGTLLMTGPTRPTSMAFYASAANAIQAYARVRDNVAKEGGTMIRDGSLLVIWGSPPIQSVHASEQRCALQP
jgi:hypothetical protein